MLHAMKIEYCRHGFSYGFYFCKLNLNANFKFEILSCRKFPSLWYLLFALYSVHRVNVAVYMRATCSLDLLCSIGE